MSNITVTVGSGKDYSSLITAESSEQATYGDLVTDGNTITFEIYGTVTETAIVEFAGWNTDSAHFVTITSGTGEGHDGVIGGGAVLQSDGSFYGQFFYINSTSDYYYKLKDLEIRHQKTTTDSNCLQIRSDNSTTERCILYSAGTNNSPAFHIGNEYQDGNILRNSLIYGDGGQTHIVIIQGETTVQNCTIIANSGTESYCLTRNDSDTAIVTNVACYGAATADFNLSGSDSGAGVTATYNASSDTSATGTGAVTGITSADFNDYANDDFSPASGGDLIDAGTDLSGTFTDDIAGNTRG